MTVIDEIASKVMQAAALAADRNKVPRDVIADGFYRGALAILIAQVGVDAAVSTLRESADRLEEASGNGETDPVLLPVLN